jgi:hypothetical protein
MNSNESSTMQQGHVFVGYDGYSVFSLVIWPPLHTTFRFFWQVGVTWFLLHDTFNILRSRTIQDLLNANTFNSILFYKKEIGLLIFNLRDRNVELSDFIHTHDF